MAAQPELRGMRLAAITLAVWVFGLAPVLCAAGYLAHACEGESLCWACGSDNCQRHSCHNDPCRVDAARQVSNDLDDIPVHAGDMALASFNVDPEDLAARPAASDSALGDDTPGPHSLLAINLPLIV